jgi:DNA-binding LacI/PurR family transcriptional regulator
MNVTEVAKCARVSPATVSRVLKQPGCAERFNARSRDEDDCGIELSPNLHARTLAGGRSRTLGIVMSNMANPVFFDVFEGLESAALARGYEVVAANIGYQPERLVSSIHLVMGRRVSGLAVIVSEMDPALRDELHHPGHTRMAFVGHHARLAPIDERRKASSKPSPATRLI